TPLVDSAQNCLIIRLSDIGVFVFGNTQLPDSSDDSPTIGLALLYNKLTSTPPVPTLKDTWWGKGPKSVESAEITPFSISVKPKVIENLNARLDAVLETLTPPLYDVNFEYGFNTVTFRKVIDFWRNKYDWKTQEKFLNSVPHFKTKISGLSIHFIHVKPKLTATQTKTHKVLPLLMLHGWPGSVREMYEIIPMLTTPRQDYDYVFELIIPSLPGYGFSEGAYRPGMNTAQMGLIMKKLMEKLGFPKFYIQGGDWGSAIGSDMSLFFPESVLGFHSNMCFTLGPMHFVKLFLGSITWPTLFADEISASHIYPLSKTMSKIMRESGYMHIQGTKPDTIGIALGDSPAGLAAYILEKFSTWTKESWMTSPDGGLNLSDKPMKGSGGSNLMPLTALLDNVMIYYITGSITTSVRLYSENFAPARLSSQVDAIPVETVPVACARFPEELIYMPEFSIRSKFHRLVHLSDLPRGGHFAAMEEPKLLADDVWDSVKLMELENMKDQLKKEKAEREKAEKEKAAKEKAEKARAAKEKAEKQKAAKEKVESGKTKQA
ncbi:juvenile hormone epoxide hydrolase 1-like, partial [Hetaerina americana]|uniref:juvenile hormone epoxide hydrolase 1-like n=1 Tax=Hetaerina americana TaxID=62018 RepID=UPI003A7F13AB